MRFDHKNNVIAGIIVILTLVSDIIFFILTQRLSVFCVFLFVIIGFSVWYVISAIYYAHLYQRLDEKRAELKKYQEDAAAQSNQMLTEIRQKGLMREEAWNTEYENAERERKLAEEARRQDEPVAKPVQPINDVQNAPETVQRPISDNIREENANKSNGQEMPHTAENSVLWDKYRKYEQQAQSYGEMEGHEFEHFFADTISQIGYTDVSVTQGSGDYGVDVLAVYDGTKCAFQCKRYKGSVGIKAVQEVFTGKMHYGAERGIVVTTGKFTKQSKDMAHECQVNLWGKEELQDIVEMALSVYRTKANDGTYVPQDKLEIGDQAQQVIQPRQTDKPKSTASGNQTGKDTEARSNPNGERFFQIMQPIFESSVYTIDRPTTGKYRDKIIEIIDTRNGLHIANLWCHVRRIDIVLPISVISRIPAEYKLRESCKEIEENDMLKGQPAKSFRNMDEDALVSILKYMATHDVM